MSKDIYIPPLEGRRGKIRLDFNENTLGCSPKVLEAIRSVTAEELSMYPEYTKLLQELADYVGVKPNQVMVTNGGDEAIKLMYRIFLEKGDRILIPYPTFTMFTVLASQVGAEQVLVPYKEDMSFPTEEVLEAIDDTIKMIILVTPNNPTGTMIEREDIIKIIEKAGDTIVFLDEAYYEYCGENLVDKLNDFPNLVILRTFSKANGLAGLRLGYLIASDDILSELNTIKSPYGVNTVAVKAARAAMQDKEFVKDYVEQINENRDYLYDQLKVMGADVYPTKANFMLVKMGEKKQDAIATLQSKGILVRDMSRFEPIKDCIRITVGTREQCDALLEGLREVIE